MDTVHFPRSRGALSLTAWLALLFSANNAARAVGYDEAKSDYGYAVGSGNQVSIDHAYDAMVKARDARNAVRAPAQYQDHAANLAALNAQGRLQKQWEAEMAAYENKQAANALVRRAEAYRKLRALEGGRMALEEPPTFASQDEAKTWFVARANYAPEDPYVTYVAAMASVDGTRQDATPADARRWIAQSDQSWPEVQALRGRMLLLGEGGPADLTQGWALLRRAESSLSEKPWDAAGRTEMYYAMGRAYAEGLGVAIDPVKALQLWDENFTDAWVSSATWVHVTEVFWRAHENDAAQIVEAAQRKQEFWNRAPWSTLTSASEIERSPEQLDAERKKNGFVPATLKPAGQPALKRQLFLSQLATQQRGSSPTLILRDIEEIEQSGLKIIAAERLMPDLAGDFFRAPDDATRAAWLAAGREPLRELAERGNLRAIWGETWLAAGKLGAPADLPAMDGWAEQALVQDSPWCALIAGATWWNVDQDKARVWLARAETAKDAPAVADKVWWWIDSNIRDESAYDYLSDLRERWIAIGATGDNIPCILLASQHARRRLSPRAIDAEKNEEVWAESEAILTKALERITVAKDRKQLRDALELVRKSHETYAEDVDKARQEAVAKARERETEEGKEYALWREKCAARRAAEGAGAFDRVVEVWTRLAPELEKAEFPGDWTNLSSIPGDRSQGLSAEEYRVELLLSAGDNAEAALAGRPRLARESLADFGEAFPDSPLLPAWRKALVTTYENRVKRGDGEAAADLAELFWPNSKMSLAERLEAQAVHRVRWLRRAIELGHESAIYSLPDSPFYKEIDRLAHERYDLTKADIAELGRKYLPDPAVELAAIQAECKKQAAVLELAAKRVAAELPTIDTRVEASLVAMENEASRVREGQPPREMTWDFDHYEGPEDWVGISQLNESPERDRVLFARDVELGRHGHYAALQRVAERWQKDDPVRLARLIAAAKPLLTLEATSGSRQALEYIAFCYQASGDARSLTGWPRDELESVNWVRRGLLAGAQYTVKIPLEIYSGQLGSRLNDPGKYRAWEIFSDKLDAAHPDPTSEQLMAFARENLPAE